MRRITPKRVLVAVSALSLAVGAGGAIASNNSSKNSESFLSRVAGHLGISTEKLEDATEAAAIDEVDEQLEAGRITKAQADELKARIRQGGVPFLFGGRHRFGGPGGFDGPRLHHAPFGHLSAAADYLGLTVPQLLEQLTSGKSLADVAGAQDKSVDGLKKAMLADAKTRLDDAVEEGMLTEAQAKEKLDAIESNLDDIVNGKFPDRGERHFRSRGGSPDNGAWRLPPGA